MKVHLITSRPTLENDIITLRKMIAIIEKSGHTLAYDWIEGAYERSQNPAVQYADWSKVYRDNLEVINQADVIVAETSHENFGVGYQVAFAVQQKKPVLMLRHATADKNAFVTGVEDGWVKRADYTEQDLPDIMNKFLQENDIQAKDMRFNFFIDRPIYNYLRWAAFKTGKTKAEILRELVSREIDKASDPNQL
jgi:hypothetical protein